MTICIQKPNVNQDLFNKSKEFQANQQFSNFSNIDKQSYSRHTLVVIDPSVDHWNTLIAGVSSNSKIILLEPKRDSIQQINEFIKQYPNVESLHLVSHGTPGNLKLGLSDVGIEALDHHRQIVSSWSNYLDDVPVYIYGCQVAKGKQGEEFLQYLHHLTQAKIAASTHIMGNSDHHRNWIFDYFIGNFIPELAFSSQSIATYSGTFEPVVSFSTTPDTLVETEGTLFSFNFELNEPPPAEGVVVSIDGDIPESLSQLDLFDIDVQGGNSLEGDFDFSGFNINITEQNASVNIPVFLDDDSGDAIVNDDNPLTPDDFTVTYSLLAGDGYEINPEQNSGTVSFFDTPEDVASEPAPEPEPDTDTNTGNENGEVTVFRFLQPSIGSHLYTSSETERNFIQENSSDIYTFEGASYGALDPLTGEAQTEDSNVENVYRFFNPMTGAHLYTTDETERDFIQENSNDFDFEGEQFAVYNTDIGEETIPVHRFFNTSLGVHFYTPSEAERENTEANLPNYEYEGIAYYAIDIDI